MLASTACIRKTNRIIIADIIPTASLLQSYHHGPSVRGSTQLPQSWTRRKYASDAKASVPAPAKPPVPLMPLYTEHKRKAIAARLVFNQTSLREELVWLKDPLKLSDYIVDLLRQDGFDKALELVRMASKDIACTVSWNHVIDHEMSRGRVNDAVKLYNEMKKRAQQPDARTFTILFRGFAAHTKFPNAIGRALALYQSMSAENCPVKPNIIHTNAVLNVCAQALDVDAILGVAAKLPARGAGAPNSVTFTTILNAIRTAAWENRVGSFDEQVRSRQQATDQGRRIWGEVVGRWRNGDIAIDEQLVCAVGRLLLLGYRNQDCDDVLSLVEQTMGIPRQAPRVTNGGDTLISLQRKHQDQANAVPNSKGNDVTYQESTASEPSARVESEDEDDIIGTEFDPLKSRNIRYTTPGRNTLSMVVDACIHLRAFAAAQDYWGLLTDPEGPYNISPDGENYHMYLRLLRAKHASKLVVELLEDMRRGSVGSRQMLEPKTFRIALSACVRDIKNRNVLDHAGKLVRIMLDSLDKPDIKALGMYLDVAMSPEHRDWKSLLGVLRGSAISVRNLRSFLAYGEKSELQAWQRENQEEMLKLVKRLVGAYDVAIDIGKGRMNEEEMRFAKDQKGILSGWVYRMKRLARSNPQSEEGKRKKDDGQGRDGESGEIPKDRKVTESIENDRSGRLDRLPSSFRDNRVTAQGDKRMAPDGSRPRPLLENNYRSSKIQSDAQNDSGRDLKRVAPDESHVVLHASRSEPTPFQGRNNWSSETQNDARNDSRQDINRPSSSFRDKRFAPQGENRILHGRSPAEPQPPLRAGGFLRIIEKDAPNDPSPYLDRMPRPFMPKRPEPEVKDGMMPDANPPKSKPFLGGNYRPSGIHNQRMDNKKRMTEGGRKKRVQRAQGILKDGLPTSW